jgi:Putative transposase of IS4/5 family (DUF4096)
VIQGWDVDACDARPDGQDRYLSDLTDEKWAKIEPFLPPASKSGRPIEVDLREVLNAIGYMAFGRGMANAAE